MPLLADAGLFPFIHLKYINNIFLLDWTDFADFVQLLGIASLGANDEDIKKIATIYFLTVEFGVIFEEGKRKVRLFHYNQSC